MIKDFLVNKVDDILSKYDAGKPENKPDVVKAFNDKFRQISQ
jgi:hypothetical protein